jgi:3-hydroxy-3-methylglutaryl CoA synthase
MAAPSLGSILSVGAYVPRLRLARTTIAEAIGWANPQAKSAAAGSRAIGNWDEDALTMAVEAARAALIGAQLPIGALTLASTSLPFADRDNAVLAASALDLAEDLETMDMGTSLRAGTSALAAAARRSDGVRTLVAASDLRLARPASAQELAYGDAAAAMVVGPASADAPATLLAAQHLAADFVDHYRMGGESFDYAFEERWVRDEGYSKLVPRAVAAALAAAGVAGDAVNHLVMPAPAAIARRVAQLAGLGQARLQDNLHAEVGDCGTALPLLMLAATLEAAQPAQTIVVIGFGQGVDVLVLRTGAAVTTGAPRVASTIARRTDEPSYTRYLAHRGIVKVDFGMRAERDQRTAQSVAWRKHRDLTAFVGGRCSKCGTVQFPRSRVCVNPSCRTADTQLPHRLADGSGRVKSFTEDWQAYTPRPPYMYGNIEFADGGNLLMEFTDAEPGEFSTGDTVRFVFRIKDEDRVRAYRRYFWKAVKA